MLKSVFIVTVSALNICHVFNKPKHELLISTWNNAILCLI